MSSDLCRIHSSHSDLFCSSEARTLSTDQILRVKSSIRGMNGPLTRYAKLRVAHAPGMPGTFSPPSLVIDPDMHHGTCLTHVP